jgi:nitrogen regulatory protein PII
VQDFRQRAKDRTPRGAYFEAVSCRRRPGGPAVKKIEAFIRHEAFEPIRSELLDKGFPSLSISEVKGSGRQKGLVEAYRGSAVTVSVRPKLKLEVIVRDEDTGTIAETIIRHERSGEIGDGKIFVMPVEEAIRIRTGEEGEDVLQAHEGPEVPAA